MISIKALKHQYASFPAVTFADWQVEKGSKWLILGNSGDGKTTLIHILSGLLKPSYGQVEVNGTQVYALKAKALDHFRGQNIGLVFQRPHLIRSLSVYENLAAAQHFSGLAISSKRIEEVLTSLNIADKKRVRPHQLSHGQLQRVSIARAVINQPTLLIADEPTSNLDDKNVKAVIELLFSQSEANGSTLIIATHDQRVISSFRHIYKLS